MEMKMEMKMQMQAEKLNKKYEHRAYKLQIFL